MKCITEKWTKRSKIFKNPTPPHALEASIPLATFLSWYFLCCSSLYNPVVCCHSRAKVVHFLFFFCTFVSDMSGALCFLCGMLRYSINTWLYSAPRGTVGQITLKALETLTKDFNRKVLQLMLRHKEFGSRNKGWKRGVRNKVWMCSTCLMPLFSTSFFLSSLLSFPHPCSCRNRDSEAYHCSRIPDVPAASDGLHGTTALHEV